MRVWENQVKKGIDSLIITIFDQKTWRSSESLVLVEWRSQDLLEDTDDSACGAVIV